MKQFKFVIFGLLLLIFQGEFVILGVSPDLINLGILMKENKEQLEFINIVLSNFLSIEEIENEKKANTENQSNTNDTTSPTQTTTDSTTDNSKLKNEEHHKLYQLLEEANNFDFEGNKSYMQSRYSVSYRQLRYAQEKLKEIYEIMSSNYLDSARVILEYASPMVIRGEDAIAKHLLQLGYRDLRQGEDFFTIGLNTNPFLFRYKLQQFSESIKIARRARRFAIRAILASKTPNVDKAEYQYKNLDEYLNKEKNEEQYSDYIKVKNTLINYIENDFIIRSIPNSKTNEKIDLLQLHDDNYAYITDNHLSILSNLNDNLIQNKFNQDSSKSSDAEEKK